VFPRAVSRVRLLPACVLRVWPICSRVLVVSLATCFRGCVSWCRYICKRVPTADGRIYAYARRCICTCMWAFVMCTLRHSVGAHVSCLFSAFPSPVCRFRPRVSFPSGDVPYVLRTRAQALSGPRVRRVQWEDSARRANIGASCRPHPRSRPSTRMGLPFWEMFRETCEGCTLKNLSRTY